MTENPGAADESGHGSPAADDGLVEAVLVVPKGLVPAILVVMVIIAAWAILVPAPLHPLARPDLTLNSWRDGAARLAEQRTATLRSTPKLPGEEQIAHDFALWLALESTRGTADVATDPRARQQLAALEERVRNFGIAHDRGGLAAAAMRWARQVRLEVDQVGAPPTKGHRSIAPGLSKALSGSGVTRWRSPDGHLSPAAALVVEGVAEQRYLALARRLPHPRPQVGSGLQNLLLRFRVEAHTGLSLRRRLQLAEELTERDPAWPRSYATAVLMARARRFRAAKAWFTRAANEGEQATQARRNARWCRQQLRRQR
ncbi:MAG: hypothetical protein KC502_01535 [Myxococcales bacterium]|nr:hypothetical protein [Myxococcales bacterium]